MADMTTRDELVAHTPGPWRLAPASAYVGTDLNIDAGQNGTGDYICSAGQRGDVNSEANARLIAAAPDLLAALMVIRHQWAGHSEQCGMIISKNQKCDCDWPKVRTQCDAAIAKATGEA